MDALEALFSRRSIRQYTDEPVSDEDLRLILRGAMQAPSAQNERPWHFIVVRNRAGLDQLAKATPYSGPAGRAQVVVVVCGDLNAEKASGFWVQDCSAAIENMLIAARARDIGTVWCGIHPSAERVEHLRRLLGIPEHVVPLGLVCMGHPQQKFAEADRFDPDRIHSEKW